MDAYGRQFVAGVERVENEQLRGHESFGAFHLRLHEKLPATRVAGRNGELLLLGHMIDPTQPSNDNEATLQSLGRCASFEQLEKAMASLAGRWLLFARVGDAARLYPDATGSKSAFYSGRAVASQPGLLGYAVDNTLDAYPGACTWPMGSTPFRGVRQLLPNHFLDLKAFRAIRFGPSPVAGMSIDDAVPIISRILTGTIEALTRRGSVALPLTAGHDSRTLLSAAYPVRHHVDLFTVVDAKTARHDRVIPPRLAKLVGRPLRFVHAGAGEDVRANTCGLWRDENQHRLSSFAQADFVVLGHVSEILRCFYWKDGIPRHVTPELLSNLAGFGGALQDQFAGWLETVPPDSGANLLDTFYWESRAGLWSSLCCTALDGFCDVISPYSCRELLDAGLGVDVAYRRQPHELHRRLCRTELQAVPFNDTVLERLYALLPRWLPWRAHVLIKRLARLGN